MNVGVERVTLSQHKESHGSHGNFYEREQEQCCSVPVGALYGGQRVSQWHKLCWSHAGVSLAGNQIRMQTKQFELKFISCKHSQGQPFSLSVIEAQGQGPCPVRAMQAYLQVRGDRPGPLFHYATGHAILRNDLNKELRRALLFCDLDPTTFKSHSFRIGAATTAAQLGMSDSQIRSLGRLKSDAFKQYIRCAALTSTL